MSRSNLSDKEKTRVRLLITATALFVLFLAIGYFTSFDAVIKVDIAFSRLFAVYRPGWLTGAMNAFSLIGYLKGGLIILALAAVALAALKLWREALFLFLTLGVLPITEFFKFVFARPRPTAALIDFKPVAAAGPSYPSGHAAFSAAAFGFMIFLAWRLLSGRKKIWLIAPLAALILAVAASRIYLGAHFLTDVIGGLLLGTAWALALGAAYIFFQSRGKNRRGE